MKKYLISAAVAIAGLSAFNMQAEEPNRLLLNFPGEFNFQSYVLGNVDNISFINVPGEVRAEVEVNDVRENELTVSVKRSASCTSYLLNVVPTAMVRMYSDPTVMFKYLRSIGSHEFADDFNNGTLSGIELNPGGEYSVVTAARDSYGTDVEISHCEFTAYAPPVEGNPQVTAELVKADKFSFTIKFTPNADVLEYYTVAGEKGEIQRQYEEMGAFFGASCLSDIIKLWGLAKSGPTENTWNDMEPGKEYEVFILPIDKNANYAPLQIFTCTTENQGGSGEAVVTVTPGKYVMNDWDGEQKPSLFVSFTPNDETRCYRFGVYKEETYNTQKTEILEDLCSEPPVPNMAHWFFFEPIETDFQVDPSTPVVIVAAGKNADDKWCDVTEVRYTTPAATSGMPALVTGNDVVNRLNSKRVNAMPANGFVPAKRAAKITIK